VALPLDGIRVLDFTRHMAGPYGTVTLSDFGADVIKVESVPSGDPSRRIGTAFVGGESGLFLMWNRGKRSVALDLASPDGLAAARRIAATCDVVFESYRPGVADEIGIGWEDLSTENPGLVYVSVSAFGPTGPLVPYPGTDPVVQAMSGVMSVTGERDGGPVLCGVPIADFTGAMLGAQAAMLGLLARERTGRGQHIDVSMLYGLMSALTTRLASFWAEGEDPARWGSEHSVVAPYQAFATADGHAVAGVWGGRDGWERFCAAVDRPDLLDDPRFAENVDRVRNRDALTAELTPVFAARPTAEWEERFNRTRALFGPVLSFSQLFAHPQVVAAGLEQEVVHPTAGPVPMLGPVIAMSDTPGRIAAPPPLLGQHTRSVLSEAGYGAGEIDDLLADGVAVETLPERPVSASR
jgi:crotonobetainyl-CoA:carnitine CoA-transferase CaiB-like acyl-CoA transferase